MNTKIKICGLTKPEEASWLMKEKVDFAGMVLFCPKSKRNITPEQAREILSAFEGNIKTVAVLLSPTQEELNIVQTLPFDYLQIHGELSKTLRKEIKLPFLRAFNVKNVSELEEYREEKYCVGYVFDAAMPGSGKTFDWKLLLSLPRDEKMWFLAGGLHAGNVSEAIQAVRPDVVDVSSGVEYVEKAGKDPEKITAFVRAVREGTLDERI